MCKDPMKQLTRYELSMLFDQFSKTLKASPLAALQHVDEITEAGVFEVTEHIRLAMKRLEEFSQKFHEMTFAVCKQDDEAWAQIKASREQLARRINSLPRIEAVPTYGMKELIDIAERCSRLTDEQWSRVVELAKALGPKG